MVVTHIFLVGDYSLNIFILTVLGFPLLRLTAETGFPTLVSISFLCFRCKGDVLQAMEMMVNGYQEELAASSAFSPLGPPPNFHRYSPSRRFLSAPYAGTGYLPTVIRPPPDYGLSMVGSLHDIYNSEKTTTSSPGSNTGSDKTSYSE